MQVSPKEAEQTNPKPTLEKLDGRMKVLPWTRLVWAVESPGPGRTLHPEQNLALVSSVGTDHAFFHQNPVKSVRMGCSVQEGGRNGKRLWGL